MKYNCVPLVLCCSIAGSTLDLSDNIVLDELDYDANFDSNYCTFQDFLFLTFQGSKLTLLGPAFKNYVKGQGGEESSPP